MSLLLLLLLPLLFPVLISQLLLLLTLPLLMLLQPALLLQLQHRSHPICAATATAADRCCCRCYSCIGQIQLALQIHCFQRQHQPQPLKILT
jgi:hypothetical protein